MSDTPAALPRVGVVIVNFHQPDLTRAALRSALDSAGVEVRVFLVDNESTPQRAQQDFAADPQVVLIVNAANVGFGAACNQGIEAALAWGAEGVLLLNNDARVAPDAAALLLPAAREAGLAAPLILFPDGKVYSAGGVAEPGRARCFNRGFGAELRPEWLQPTRCAFASGCALMLSRAALAAGPRFFEPYFLYYEDADLCLRLGEAGFGVAYVPAARVTHEGSATTGGPAAPAPGYFSTRNRWLLLRRNVAGMARFGAGLYLIAAAARECIADVLAGRGPRARAVAAGLRDGLLGRFGPRP